MQIRRLRFVRGSLGIVGQVINIPVDVNTMVSELPRQLDDDRAFNVQIKRHLIHKSTYLRGYVKKSVVKAWLRFLVNKPLYRMNGIRIDESLYCEYDSLPALAPVPESEADASAEPLIEPISEDPTHVNDLLLAKQHTLMWSEEKYLVLAPGMNKRQISLLYDEYAEELSFPSIYLGEPRTFTIQGVTPFMMANSEIRRTDRRGVKPEHILYMTMKVMRMRLTESIYCTFKANDNLKKLTRENVEDVQFMNNMIENNLSFLKSIPNSVQYWMARKKDVFAMIRQLGKPTIFLTLSASEYGWSDLLRLLYRLEMGKEWKGEEDPATSMSSDLRTTLVNEDPVTCCLYFNKLVDTIMFLLKSKSYSPFGDYHVVDYFKRIEFQQRGSPHAHILLWLKNDPKEPVDENMPATIQLIDSLISVDQNYIEQEKSQIHKHTFTCYKRAKDEENNRCRFGAPFWPMQSTMVLLPLTKEDGRRDQLKQKYADMHHSLEFEEFDSLNAFLQHHNIQNYDYYLNILCAGISRPRVFIKRTIQQRWMNNFNPWVAKVLRSNMDIQFILEEYSCATYVVEYVNKTNRGISNLQRELIKLRDDYLDKDYSALLVEVGLKMLNAVEISSQEGAWYLLNLHMSEGTRKVEYIPTVWPHERQCVRKSKKQMDNEKLGSESTDIWNKNIIEKYESRPENMATTSLAQFVAHYYQERNTQNYKQREIPKVLRYRNYELAEANEYKREMVLLHLPFRNEEIDVLDNNRYQTLYDEHEAFIMEARKEFESNLDIAKMMEECHRLFTEDENDFGNDENAQVDEYVKSKAVDEDFVQNIREGLDDDIRMRVMEKMSSVVRKRENVMSAEEYCIAMRCTNQRQRDLVLEVIHRIFTDGERKPLQIFLTGPAGSGKTFTMKMLMETYNRFSQQHNNAFNAYVASASTGMAASAINGATVHAVFRIGNSQKTSGLSVEALNAFRAAFANVRVVFVDECSMIGSGLLGQINSRLQHILHDHERPFAGMDMVFTGDLRQLPPVCQTAIYKRSRQNFCCEIVWQSLEYYPLVQVMRQADVAFSSVLTKIGDGQPLLPEEKAMIESRFVEREFVDREYPESIRLFFRTIDVTQFNVDSIRGAEMVEYVATDHYTGQHNSEQLASARAKVHKMKPDETGGLPYILRLHIGKPYMIRANIDVLDSLVNGAIGTLRYIERNVETGEIKRLWLSFGDPKIGRLLRAKAEGYVRSNPDLNCLWVPIARRTCNIQTTSKIISCKRTQFPLVEACAITIHKSQGGTYNTVVYEYNRSHEQQLVYVALSRATSLQGLFITNQDKDHTFYHHRGKENKELSNEFKRLERHPLQTIGDTCRDFLDQSTQTDDPTLLSLGTFNTQSLKAHLLDITTDFVLPRCKLLSISETWVENDHEIEIPGFHTISRFKRNTVRAAGVMICENMTHSNALQSTEHDLLKFDESEMKVKRIATSHDGVGDICSIETTINGKRALLVSVYISPNTPLKEIRSFFILNLLAYSPKLKGLFEDLEKFRYYEIPIILSGDLNLDLCSPNGAEFIEFMNTELGLQLSNDSSISTSRHSTCIDAVFSRHIDHLETRHYISYFSTHRPLLSITSTSNNND